MARTRGVLCSQECRAKRKSEVAACRDRTVANRGNCEVCGRTIDIHGAGGKCNRCYMQERRRTWVPVPCRLPGCSNLAKRAGAIWDMHQNRKKRSGDYGSAERWIHARATPQKQYAVIRQRMLAEQGGRCRLCGTTETWRWVLDHDHACERHPQPKDICADCIRGVLCHTCNVFLGMVQDCPNRLRSALEYLGHPASLPKTSAQR